MLRPDPKNNETHDPVWFGVLTWVQPKEEVEQGEQRLVCIYVLPFDRY